MRWALSSALICMALRPMPGSAQTVDSYELRAYNVGAKVPVQTFAFPAANVTCNLAPTPTGGSTVNPTTAEWDDPGVAGRVCRFVQGAGLLFAMPTPGSFEAVLVAVNQAGGSPESNRAPFSRLDLPDARMGFRVVR